MSFVTPVISDLNAAAACNTATHYPVHVLTFVHTLAACINLCLTYNGMTTPGTVFIIPTRMCIPSYRSCVGHNICGCHTSVLLHCRQENWYDVEDYYQWSNIPEGLFHF